MSKSYTLDYSSKCPCTFLANLPLQMPLLYKECIEHGYNFIDNGAISTTDLWTDGIHLLESGIMKITKNLISSFNSENSSNSLAHQNNLMRNLIGP